MEIGVPDAAQRLGVSVQRVRQLLANGQLVGRQVGRRWLVDEKELSRASRVSRPFSPRMAAELIRLSEGAEPRLSSATERHRLRVALQRIKTADNPADLLRSWLPSRAERRAYSISEADIADLKADPRLTVSGISDPRAGLSAGGESEGYVAQQDHHGLVADYLLVPSPRPNVYLHVVDRSLPGPLPLLVIAADLADHNGAREDGQVRKLIAQIR